MVLLAYPCIFIYLTCENHTPPKVPLDKERAKNSVAFSAWFSQVSSSYHSDTFQAHRKKPCWSEHLGKSRPGRLVQIGLPQEWCCPSSRDRLVRGKPLIVIVSKAWRFLKTNNLFLRARGGWMREEGGRVVSEHRFPPAWHPDKKKLNRLEVNSAIQCHLLPSGKFMPCS